MMATNNNQEQNKSTDINTSLQEILALAEEIECLTENKET